VTLSSAAAFLVFVLLCVAAAATGSLFRPGTWYESLRKPSWRPPNWLFAPVWSALYLMMAIAGWLVWERAGLRTAAGPLALWLGQLILNAVWTPVFFGLKRTDLGLIIIVVLCVAIAATIAAFAPVSTAGAWLMVPYLGWVAFATVLNFEIWRLNRPVAVG
jgi:tryptophan-rich sensory protein